MRLACMQVCWLLEMLIMCKDCFNNEIKSFPSENEWPEFDLSLTKKLVSGKMKNIDFINDGKREKNDGEHVYVCQSCSQKWKLKDPDYSFRGYFLKKN